MFIIRREQMALLQAQLVTAFENFAIRQLRKRFQTRTQQSTDDHLRLMVRDAIDRSGRYGIGGEDDVMRYLEYMISYGRDFDSDPSIKRILRVRNLSGSDKMNRIAQIKSPQYDKDSA